MTVILKLEKKTKRNKFGEHYYGELVLFCHSEFEKFVRHPSGQDIVDNWVDKTRIHKKFWTGERNL